MSSITITCPGCARSVRTEGPSCPECGTNVAAQLIQAHADAIRQTAEQWNRRPRHGGTTVNGWGTTLLDYQPRGDGTWNATRWFTLAYIPLVPLKGVRLRPVRREGHNARQTLVYDVLEEARPPIGSVFRVIGLLLAGAAPPLLFFFWGSMVKRLFGTGPLAFFVGLALIAWAGFILMRIHNEHRAFRGLKD
ncbi:MAG TPA: hypothetical protein VFJ16_19310 [Longimicrobium sp.]|nr:hypothetical protein [Longimicrobium sp.]